MLKICCAGDQYCTLVVAASNQFHQYYIHGELNPCVMEKARMYNCFKWKTMGKSKDKAKVSVRFIHMCCYLSVSSHVILILKTLMVYEWDLRNCKKLYMFWHEELGGI